MAKTTTIGTQNITTIDLTTVLYNRGTVETAVPYGGQPLAAATSRAIGGNLIENSRPGKAIRLGSAVNALHDSTAFVYVSGTRWRQYRALTQGATYAIVPRSDCESVFIEVTAGDTNVTLDLNHADLLPGMSFKFERPVSAGNLIITFSNGNVMNPSNGANGTVITITQFGFATIRILGGAVSGGPKVFIEESSNATVS